MLIVCKFIHNKLFGDRIWFRARIVQDDPVVDKEYVEEYFNLDWNENMEMNIYKLEKLPYEHTFNVVYTLNGGQLQYTNSMHVTSTYQISYKLMEQIIEKGKDHLGVRVIAINDITGSAIIDYEVSDFELLINDLTRL